MTPDQRQELEEAIKTVVEKAPGDEMALQKVIDGLNAYLVLDNRQLEIIQRPLADPEPIEYDPMKGYDAWAENNYALQLEERGYGEHNPGNNNLIKNEL